MNISPEVQIALIAVGVIVFLVIVFKDRVAEVVFGPAKMTLFKPEEMQDATAKAKEIVEREAPKTPEGFKPQWQKVATLYWLGNDLMWIIGMLYRGALPEQVLQGVDHAKHYLTELGFTEASFPFNQLGIATPILKLLKGVTGSTAAERRTLKQQYTSVIFQIQSIKWYISSLAEKEQPEFIKQRKTSAFPMSGMD